MQVHGDLGPENSDRGFLEYACYSISMTRNPEDNFGFEQKTDMIRNPEEKHGNSVGF